MEVNDWEEYLSHKQDEARINQIRVNAASGKPLGEDRFITKLEKFLGRSIKSLPRGRPRNK